MCEVKVLFNGYSEQLDDRIMCANCSCTLIKGPKLIIVDTMTAWDQKKILEEHIVGHSVQHGDLFYEENLKNEEYILCEGVKVLATPGHTSEDITVLVQTNINGRSSCVAITGDLFEKEEDIVNPLIWKSLGQNDLQKVQSYMRSRIINLADFIVPGHGPMFSVTDKMRQIVDSQVIK
ncbi:metallo-beta-lactamase domain-containing protein 1 isoform X2 [Vespa velutina]|uniref:metallo-beta-lactamase domain-containing protein 1 isoform X2 n=1 Tax=Vespa crabro TaxID=7445 RepID=UPI001F019CD8|nr:metallo-beta-lactamase domain-containing protein 1 isoform X2 [Vespa crabro]XP_047360306.1 metallo-beta-lactamase domain-containing protein 1 isoform X2 [Vespa velutina]